MASEVRIPPGTWRGSNGEVVDGPADITVDVTLESMPVWERSGA